MRRQEIEHLTPLEHVRLRPGMYVGDCSDPTQLLIEILANAIDEHNAGHGDVISVISSRERNMYTVVDHGRGFPVDELDEQEGKTVLQLACDTPNTSGKFREDGSYNGVSTGCNGLGMVLTNFLSHEFIIASHRGGIEEYDRYVEGVLQEKFVNEVSDFDSGTSVSFIPSEEFFESPKVDMDRIRKFCEEICCLTGPSLMISIDGDTIRQPDGIRTLLYQDVDDNNLIDPSQEFIDDITCGQQRVQIGITFVDGGESRFQTFVNYGPTTTGAHQLALRSMITHVFSKQARDGVTIDGICLRESMLLVANIISPGVGYDAQIKTRVTKIPTDFIKPLGDKLTLWLNNHPNITKKVIDRMTVLKKADAAARALRKKIQGNNNGKMSVSVSVSKLSDCHCRNRSLCELYITEGDSASGGARMVRDARTQAIMGLKGKILNVKTSTIGRIKGNDEIVDIVTALGFSSDWRGEKIDYDESKLRYDKVIIAADRDRDGAHIQSLLLTLFWELMPQLILDGHVYIAYPPLYKAEWGKQYHYLADRKVLEEFKRTYHDTNFTLSYFKGLGECSPQELRHMIINPQTRDIQQVSVDDVNRAFETISLLMGKDTKGKRDFVFSGGE